MFNWISRKIRFLTNQNKIQISSERKKNNLSDVQKVYSRLNDNLSYMKSQYGENYGIIYRTFQIGKEKKLPALLVGVDGMVEKEAIQENIISPLMRANLDNENSNLISYLKDSVISVMEITEEENMLSLIARIFNGSIVLFVDGEKKALVIGVQAWEKRGIKEPVSETVVRGPREGFIESIQTNLVMLRRRIIQPNLKMDLMIIGKNTQTKVVVSYIKGIANEEIVKEVKERLEKITADSILETGFIEEYIEDAKLSLFPTISNTEKPDIVAARLLEGRVAIFVDGTPSVLTVPNILLDSFQIAEDYYSRPFYASFIRLIRTLGFLITIMLPGTFIAFQNFHTEVIPTPLIITLSFARDGVPFPLVAELLLMVLMFEWLREAGIRMPKPVGQAVNIVGALILGETAIAAGLVGAPTVIVIAATGITSFMVPSLSETVVLLRILFIIVSAVFGLYGIMLFGMVIVTHLASIRSFGIPYSAPLFPIIFKDWKDSLIRLPLWLLKSKPRTIRPSNSINKKRGGWGGDND